MKKLLVVFSLVFVGVAVQAQDTYTKKLHDYLEAGGAMASFQVAVKGMIENGKKLNNQIPNEVWDELETEMSKSSLDDLVGFLAPVYKQHLTESDLDGLIQFYKSPVGKKLAEKTPIITQQSMQAGQAWGRQLGEKIAAKLQEKGYK